MMSLHPASNGPIDPINPARAESERINTNKTREECARGLFHYVKSTWVKRHQGHHQCQVLGAAHCVLSVSDETIRGEGVLGLPTDVGSTKHGQ